MDDWYEMTESLLGPDAEGEELDAQQFKSVMLTQLKQFLLRCSNRALVGAASPYEASLHVLKWLTLRESGAQGAAEAAPREAEAGRLLPESFHPSLGQAAHNDTAYDRVLLVKAHKVEWRREHKLLRLVLREWQGQIHPPARHRHDERQKQRQRVACGAARQSVEGVAGQQAEGAGGCSDDQRGLQELLARMQRLEDTLVDNTSGLKAQMGHLLDAIFSPGLPPSQSLRPRGAAAAGGGGGGVATIGEEREGLDDSSVMVADDQFATWSLDPGHVELHEQHRERQRQNQYELHWRQQQMVCMRVFECTHTHTHTHTHKYTYIDVYVGILVMHARPPPTHTHLADRASESPRASKPAELPASPAELPAGLASLRGFTSQCAHITCPSRNPDWNTSISHSDPIGCISSAPSRLGSHPACPLKRHPRSVTANALFQPPGAADL